MTIAAININSISSAQSVEPSHQMNGAENFSLESLVEPSSADLSAFQNTVAGFVDKIQEKHAEVSALGAKGDAINAKDLLSIQNNMSEYSIQVQLLSKAMSVATKSINQLVSMQ